MNLYQLVYVSKLPKPMKGRELKLLIERAKIKNINLDVTSLLIKFDTNLIQILEGNRHTLQELYDDIESDSRHINVRNCYFEPAEQRIFGKWALTFLNLNNEKLKSKERLQELAHQLIDARGDDEYSKSILLLDEFSERVKQ